MRVEMRPRDARICASRVYVFMVATYAAILRTIRRFAM